jgi:hypothetical protein
MQQNEEFNGYMLKKEGGLRVWLKWQSAFLASERP